MALSTGKIRDTFGILRGAECCHWLKNQTARAARREGRDALRAYREGRSEDAAPRRRIIRGWAD